MTLRASDPRGQGIEVTECGESPPSRRPHHLSPRTGLIALYAVAVAVVAGFLSFVSDHGVAMAVTAGGVAFAGAFVFFDKIIGD